MINYANWWAYFHTRMQMMKTAASNAFQTIGDTYRVGMFTISVGQHGKDRNQFSQCIRVRVSSKKDWYDKLFASKPSSYTPLRGALAKAGKYFANKLTGQVDPMQFSCQQNFTILSTDGYWNTQDETSTYGPYKLDGTNVGNQDGLEPRPFSDGATVTYHAEHESDPENSEPTVAKHEPSPVADKADPVGDNAEPDQDGAEQDQDGAEPDEDGAEAESNHADSDKNPALHEMQSKRH